MKKEMIEADKKKRLLEEKVREGKVVCTKRKQDIDMHLFWKYKCYELNCFGESCEYLRIR